MEQHDWHKHVEDPPSSEKTALKFIIRLEFVRYDKTCEIHHSTYQKKPNVNIFLNTRNRWKRTIINKHILSDNLTFFTGQKENIKQ